MSTPKAIKLNIGIGIFSTHPKKFLILNNPYYKNFKIFTLSEIVRSNIRHNEVNYKYKRTQLSYYHFVMFLHRNFYNITSGINYKQMGILSKLKRKTRNINLNYFSQKILFDQSFSLKFLKFIFLLSLVFYIVYFLTYSYDKMIDKADGIIKSLIINKICKNKTIIEKISWEILVLCKQDRTHRLIKNLILNEILPNQELKKDLYRLIKREIIAYIKSEDCRRELKNLIARDVMANPEVRSELYSLIRKFITLKDVDFLEDKLEKILVDVLNIQAIHNHVSKKIEGEINKALRDVKLIDMAIEVLMDKFK